MRRRSQDFEESLPLPGPVRERLAARVESAVLTAAAGAADSPQACPSFRQTSLIARA
jgi:hypothetical protein